MKKFRQIVYQPKSYERQAGSGAVQVGIIWIFFSFDLIIFSVERPSLVEVCTFSSYFFRCFFEISIVCKNNGFFFLILGEARESKTQFS